MVAKTYKVRGIFVALAFLSVLFYANTAASFIVISDAEIEKVIEGYTTPLFKAAGLDPSDLQIYILQDSEINAFATNGNRIFVNTGLILKAKNYTELVGVLAHETAHISGGHIVRLYDNISVAGRNSLISTILGGIAAVATGRPDVGIAVAMGGMTASQNTFLSYRRGEEHIADQIAVDILKKTGGSISGLHGMLKTLQSEERFRDNPNAYISTHPLSSDRLLFLEETIKNNGGGKLDNKKQNEFAIIQTKLAAFLGDPDKILEVLKGNTYPERYGRAIAYFRKHEIEKALTELDSLIKENPNIPYLYELKGQILFENGRVAESIAPYKKAYELLKHPLIRLSLAQAEIEAGNKENLPKTIADLKKIVAKDTENARAYRYLAIASGKIDDITYAAYYMAEYNFILKKYNEALVQARRAEKSIPIGTVIWQRLQDIIDISKNQINKKKANK